MRGLLHRIGARTGVSIGLILIVATIVLFARLSGDSGVTAIPRVPYLPPSISSADGDDGVVDEEPEANPDDEAVIAAAHAFVSAWLQRDRPQEVWLDGLRPLATEDLIDRLSGVDPLDVPAYATAGEPSIRSRSAVYADVLVPIAPHDALVLGLLDSESGWRVATVDRETG